MEGLEEMNLADLMGFTPATTDTYDTPAKRSFAQVGSVVILVVAGTLLLFAALAGAGTFALINYLDLDSLFYHHSGAPSSLYGGYLAAMLLAILAIGLGIISHQMRQRLAEDPQTVTIVHP